MRHTLSLFLLAAIVSAGAFSAHGSLQPVDEQTMAQTFGGAPCYKCTTLPNCADVACTHDPDLDKYYKATGTNQALALCEQVAEAATGASDCDTNTPKPCADKFWCNDDNCVDCGLPSTSEVDSNCALGGTKCQG
jgi:hypothetical protein